ncbi:GntR family transcriptional regulator [Bacillus sonorensis]|nr:GntR family transcriptional regulator [Bacillus sp. KRF7]MCF7620056.1 GntR family transcriptional regulator [Bacillus sonorensis]NWN80585.1 GntR family transcriptional regulator [Bacillus sp. (in: firmicutes)]MCY7857170.1 GntR family transcriptional regulator [Bacillus sonorensis]MCY8034501.1 GntR family transcriptional regulator [Bacillus sonorensis]MCY8270617.1 GntR family transcriptional regulator [Bacillus sonorensis]
MIFEGTLKPGERIAEAKLAKELGVSKSPLREAIRVLEKEGLVVIDSRVKVYKPTIKDVEEIYFCRMALESFAAGLTARIATAEELKTIEDVLRKTEEAILQSKDQSTIIELNDTFHDLIIQYTQNSLLRKQLNDLEGLIYYFRILNFEGEKRAEAILEQHREIFHHMKQRDDEQASKAMVNHLQLDLDHLVGVLSHRCEDNS